MKYSIRGIANSVGIDDVIGVVATCDENFVFDGVEPVTPLDIITTWTDVRSVTTDTKYFWEQTGTRARKRNKRNARVMKAQARKAQYIDDTLPF